MKLRSAEFIKSCHAAEQFPRDQLPEIAFVGRSNVGKSSLINSLLLRRHLAKVSRTPGKTRSVNFYKVAADGLRGGGFYVVDLPGYGYAKVSKSVREEWGPMIEGYLTGRSGLRGVVFLVDARGLGWQDRGTWQWLHHLALPTLVVTTKVDKLTRSARATQMRRLRSELGVPETAELLAYSSVTREGRETLWRAIGQLLERDDG